MNVIQCPACAPMHTSLSDKWIFMAGGISNCPDWQHLLAPCFHDMDNLLLLNPRRADFNMDDPKMTEDQIKWEHSHLDLSDAVLFWFPYETLCPITLYELGVNAAKGKKIFVACHPKYQRFADVKIQLSLIRPDVTVHDSLVDLVREVKDWLTKSKIDPYAHSS